MPLLINNPVPLSSLFCPRTCNPESISFIVFGCNLVPSTKLVLSFYINLRHQQQILLQCRQFYRKSAVDTGGSVAPADPVAPEAADPLLPLLVLLLVPLVVVLLLVLLVQAVASSAPASSFQNGQSVFLSGSIYPISSNCFLVLNASLILSTASSVVNLPLITSSI